EGRVTRDPRLRLVRERAATCVLDGDNGPGRYLSVQGMRHAMERAKNFGVGVCLSAQTSHWGRAHAYAYRAAHAGMIGICTTNAMTSMFVQGSSHSVLGNNPLAIGVPRARGQEAVVLDMAMTQAAVGKIGTYLREGKDVPLGWGLDESGSPTRDPAAILASRKFLPMGDHKGYGLCLMMEFLTAALVGGPLCFELSQLDRSTLDPASSKLFIALDVEAFVEPERFHQRVDDLLRSLRDAKGPGQEALYPGERGWRMRDRHLAEGIPIHPEIVSQLSAIGISF
ncbi:MAG TPA: Ldh family oxidoreductase, partial [Acidobacteriota bacterium]|nr:Ldh family oxidoreductase [Acidobacteriota bacterium]